MTPRLSAVLAGTLLAAFGLFAAAPQTQTKTPVDAARLNNLGAAYMNQQLFEKGLKSFQQASTIDPKLTIARLNEGIALLNLQKLDEAKSALQAALKQDPKNPTAWYNLGLLAKNTGDAQAAIDAFKHVTEIDANDADTWYFLGTTYVQAKQFPQAIEAFQQALKLNPLHASAEFGLSRAYQQSTDLDHAREHLKKFQYITQNKIGAPMSLAYGEQGQYSRAVESPSAVLKAPAQIKVQFVDVTAQVGLISKSVADPTNSAEAGACFIDYDNDGKIDLFLSDNGAQGGVSLYHNLGNGRYEDVTKQAGLNPTMRGGGCTTGDYDNDGFTDIAVTVNAEPRLFHNQKNGTFNDLTATAGLSSVDTIGEVLGRSFGRGASALTFIDYDHDGDLDLFTTCSPAQCQSRGAANDMWRNNGDGTFTNVTRETGLSDGVVGGYGAIGTDYNNDRAVDIVVAAGGVGIGSPSSTTLFPNPREGRFVRQDLIHPMPANPAVGVAVLDFDHDGWMDLAFTHMGAPGITLWRNNHGRTFDRIQLPETNWVRAYGVAAIDYDNDGWVDLVAVGETKDGKGEVRLFRNLGADGFKDVTVDVGLDKIQLKEPRAIITGDYDGDGATDFLITQNHGPAVLLRNERGGGNQNHWLRLSLKGLNDNKSAIGTKVEVFAGGNRQKFEIAGSNGYLGQNSTDIVVGLGDAKEADIVRLTWPTGVLQDEINVAGDKQQDFTEIDRRGSSCPTLFVWNGERYELVADMLGAGVVGHWIGPGQRDVPRPVEWIKIDPNAIREKDGKLSFRFMEPLEEAVYLDQARLLAVDHPAGVEVYPNEYFASNPPYPEFKVVVSNGKDAKPPAGAWDEHGHNVLPDLLAQHYSGDFTLTQFQGFAKPHSLTLDLGDAYRGGPLWLLLHGEVEYFSANSMYAASQAGVHAISPYVEALVGNEDANGKWVRVIDDMGFPAGGPRTMTADLSGKLPVGTQKIRITTNLQIYWDSILIDRTAQDGSARQTPVPLVRADLGFHGFPFKIEGTPPGNVQYVYEKVSATGPYTRPAGTYTRYGDVLPLLTALDDKSVVFGSGDEVRLDFDPSGLPALPQGWVRDYLFAAKGYEKDMDFYAAEGNFVAPLPFLRMDGYPYAPGKSFPLDDAHLNYLLEYNTRHMSGNEQRGYSFDYGKR